MNLYNILIAKKLSGGGGGGGSTLINKNISANGTYTATNDNADGYKKVVVNVPNPSTGSLSITSNNTYDVTNYASAVVNVPNPSTGTLSISANGTYDVTNYASADVSVSGWSNEDVATRSYTGDIVLNNVTSIRDWAFNSSSITSISSNTVTEIRQHAFSQCSSLTSISFPNANGVVYGSAFANCSNLTSITIPNINYFQSGYIFTNDSKLTEVMMPNYSYSGSRSTGGNVFEKCTSLSKVDLGKCIRVDGNCFLNCTNFSTLILRNTSVCALGATSAFNGTPFASGGTGGEIYVPSSLISSYQSATNWSTIHGYGTITWKAIEGSIYEL